MANKFPPGKETYTLYGAEFSLYSGKLRSYLRKKGVPYTECLSDLKTYKKFIVPRSGVRFIPVLQTPQDEVLQDTTVIIDYLEGKYPENPVYPGAPKQHLASLLLEVYGDEWLVIPAMLYRWNFPQDNQPFIYLEFGKTFFPKLPRFIQLFIGKKLGSKFQGFLPMLGITDNSAPAIEASYLALLTDLNVHFGENNFLLGDIPSVGDFGLIGPLYAHLYRDPYPGDLMKKHAPNVAAWVERMTSEKVTTGSFLPDDQIPETLEPIFQRMSTEHIPVLLDTAIRVDLWQQQNPGKEIPRTIGEHQFTVEGITERRASMPYNIWMWQRPLDYYQALSAEQKATLNPWLDRIGMKQALNTPLNTRLKRVHNKLEFE